MFFLHRENKICNPGHLPSTTVLVMLISNTFDYHKKAFLMKIHMIFHLDVQPEQPDSSVPPALWQSVNQTERDLLLHFPKHLFLPMNYYKILTIHKKHVYIVF